MIKSGLVMKKEKNTAIIMDSFGRFYKVAAQNAPEIGEEFSGKVKNRTFSFQHAIAAAILLCILSTGGGAYAYYSPTATVRVHMNPDIELKTNRFDKIIQFKALNSDGEKVLSELQIKNLSLNQGLSLIVEQSRKDHFISKENKDPNEMIQITIDSKNHKTINLDQFENYANYNGFSAKINNSGIEKIINSKVEKQERERVVPDVQIEDQNIEKDIKREKGNTNEKEDKREKPPQNKNSSETIPSQIESKDTPKANNSREKSSGNKENSTKEKPKEHSPVKEKEMEGKGNKKK